MRWTWRSLEYLCVCGAVRAITYAQWNCSFIHSFTQWSLSRSGAEGVRCDRKKLTKLSISPIFGCSANANKKLFDWIIITVTFHAHWLRGHFMRAKSRSLEYYLYMPFGGCQANSLIHGCSVNTDTCASNPFAGNWFQNTYICIVNVAAKGLSSGCDNARAYQTTSRKKKRLHCQHTNEQMANAIWL